MPSDVLSVAISSGLGVSLIAGFVSGICYIVVQEYSRRRKIRLHSLWHCNVCGTQFRSIEGVLDIEKVVSCTKCGSKVCRFRCARRSTRMGWICRLCQNPEHWLKGLFSSLINRNFKESGVVMDMENHRIEELDEDIELLRKKEKEHVRDFIERIVEAMLGSNVDNVSVAKLYEHKSYDLMFSKYHTDLSNALTELGSALHVSIANLPVAGESPCSAHASLKLLIQRVIQEALELPKLPKAQPISTTPDNNNDKTYEDLLATAILNKVIQSYQDELPASSRNSISSRLSTSSKLSHTSKEYFFGEENLSSKWKKNPLSIDDEESVHSLEAWVHSSPRSLSQYDSIEIRKEIEELSSDEEDDEPQYVHTDSLLKTSGYCDEWQENWMMQRRRFNGTASPVPVPMLVPNPIKEAKVKIGDKEADETSDLSDAGSDFGEVENSQDIKAILVNSKNVIGGKNLLDKVNLSGDTVCADESPDVNGLKEDKDDVIKRFLNDKVKQRDLNNDEVITTSAGNEYQDRNCFTSLESSNTEKDYEYTEKYASLPKTIVKLSNTKNQNGLDRENYRSEQSKTSTVFHNGSDFLEENNNEKTIPSMNQNSEINSDTFKGTYAEREKSKWYQQAVEMKNNPYSEENLQRRLSSQSSNSSLFGRDYYIKQAARSAGASNMKKEKILNDSQLSCSNNEIDLKETSTTNQLFQNEIISSSDNLCYEDLISNGVSSDETHFYKSSIEKTVLKLPVETNNLLFEAKNKHVLNDCEKFRTEKVIPISNHISLETSSDSERSLERIYNIETSKVMVRVGDRIKEIEGEIKGPDKVVNTAQNFENSGENFEEKENSLERLKDEKVPYENPTGKENIRKKVYSHFLSHSPVKLKQFEVQEDQNQNITVNEISSPILETSPLSNSFQTTNGEVNEFSLDSNFSENYEKNDYKNENSTKCVSSPETDTEISEIRSKKLVKNLLNEFSKAKDNKQEKTANKEGEVNAIKQEIEELLLKETELHRKSNNDNLELGNTLENKEAEYSNESNNEAINKNGHGDEKHENVRKIENTPEYATANFSVQNLKQIFDKNHNNVHLKDFADKSETNKLVYSLTARSIPFKVRQELKNTPTLESPQKHEIIKEESSQSEANESLEDMEDVSFPKAKSKIQFFESLKN